MTTPTDAQAAAPPTTATEIELQDNLKTAMRAGDKRALAAYRMVRTKIMERRTARDAKPLDDAAVLEVIRAYVKSLEAAVAEYRSLGTAEDDENIVQLAAEVAVLEPYMPKFLDEAATLALVQAAIVATGATSRKQSGMVMGGLMKAHKGEIDPAVVKRLVDAALPA